MAPIPKRRRQDLDDEELVLESANSNMRQENVQRKKAKLSDANSRNIGGDEENDPNDTNADDDDDSSSDSDMEDTPPPAPDLPPSTQYEIKRDAGFRHLENVEEDDMQASLLIDSRKKLVGENRPAECGIVEVITCVNFMCHEHLEVKLGPLINFVIGKNGSGKSALVAALQICLGVKASSTNRGSNLKGMIKNGRDAAMVQIQIANRGQDAYLHDQYGDSIIVERSFTRVGNSSFKLKSISKRTISTKKADLEDLIEHFQFQVENPMNILTQDNAKQFITKSGPSEKYKFFVKGTQLEQLDTDYKLIFETAENYQQRVYQQEDNVKILRKKYEEKKEKARLVEKHAEMKVALKRYSHQLAWAQVEGEERELETAAKKIEEARRVIMEVEANAAIRAQEYEEADNDVMRATEEVQRLEEERLPLMEAETEAVTNFNKAQEELRDLKGEQRIIREELGAARTSIKSSENKIAQEESRLEALNGGSHSRKLAELDEAKAHVIESNSARDEARIEIGPLESQYNSANSAYEESQGPIQWKKEEILRAERRLQELNSDRGNSMNGYHPSMSRLLNRIRSDRGFSAAPIGPLGLHCKLLKPIWSDVLEASLGPTLNAFVVTNRSDQQRLSNMARELNVHTTVYIVQDEIRNLNEPDEHFDTILRVLDIENVLVRNALIINQSIDQIILIPQPKDAEKVLYHGGPSPRNVKQCFSINSRKRGWGMRYTAGQNDSFGPIRGTANQVPRMKTDISAQISKQQEVLNELRRELQDLTRTVRDRQAERDRCQKAVTQQRTLMKNLTANAQRAQERVETLEAELDDDNVVDGRLEGLRTGLQESEKQFQIHENSFVSNQKAMDEQNNKCTHLKALSDQAKSLVANYNAKIEKAGDRVKRITRNRQLSLQQKNEAIDKVEVAKAAELKAIRAHEAQAKHVDDFIQQASQICERIPVDPGETSTSLDSKIEKIHQRLDLYRKRQGGSDEEIQNDAVRAKKTWEMAAGQLHGHKQLLSHLKISLDDRIAKWRHFLKIISAHSRMNFLYLLAQRNFRGVLKFAHKQKLLEVQIEPDETRRSDKGRQTKTLSGGEKSFSSICLLLALWEAMGAPLRILDEYDVFMDEVNREVSTKMLVSNSIISSVEKIIDIFIDCCCSTLSWQAVHSHYSTCDQQNH